MVVGKLNPLKRAKLRELGLSDDDIKFCAIIFVNWFQPMSGNLEYGMLKGMLKLRDPSDFDESAFDRLWRTMRGGLHGESLSFEQFATWASKELPLSIG